MAWSVFSVVLALDASGCVSCETARVDPDAAIADAMPDTGRDSGPDVPTPPSCSGTGLVGSHCRAGAMLGCVDTAMCLDFSARATDVQSALGLRQAGIDDPSHPGYPIARTVVEPLELAPFNAAEGTLCAQQCDTSVADTCGGCTTCSAAMTQMPLLAAFGGARVALGMGATFGADTGLCRIDCTWSATGRSDECPDDAMACDSFGGVCVEACTSDVECNTTYAVTYEGELVTAIETAHPRTCSAATGRCETAGHVGAAVGDACASDADCAPGTGVCLNGGLCGEFGCPTPGTATSTCAGGAGVCLGTSATTPPQSLCLRGCDTAADCGAGNTCSLFDGGAAIGTHHGYCIGICTSDDQCAASETCTDTSVTEGGTTTTRPGTCVPRCTSVGGVGAASGGCATDEQCAPDHAGATYGTCEPADRFCGAPDTRSLPAASADCATGWVCDELLAGLANEHELFGDGHCTPACTGDADCTGRGTCVVTGALAGLCRVACTSDTECTAPQVCDLSLGACVEAPAPVP